MNTDLNELTSIQRGVIEDITRAIGNDFSFDGYSSTENKNQYIYRFTFKPIAINIELHVDPNSIKLKVFQEGDEHANIESVQDRVSSIPVAIKQGVDQLVEVKRLKSAELLTEEFSSEAPIATRRIRSI